MADYADFEQKARIALEKHLGVVLCENTININGKAKKFDIVNMDERIVGDVKNYKNTAGGHIPSAKRSILNEYCWLMQMVEKHRREKWRKLFVVGEDKEMLLKYLKDFDAWLGDIEFYYFSRKDGIERVRGSDK